jgi:hypothetical protein
MAGPFHDTARCGDSAVTLGLLPCDDITSLNV